MPSTEYWSQIKKAGMATSVLIIISKTVHILRHEYYAHSTLPLPIRQNLSRPFVRSFIRSFVYILSSNSHRKYFNLFVFKFLCVNTAIVYEHVGERERESKREQNCR